MCLLGAELNQKLFSAADNLRSKMDASEYKNYLLGLIFYKYLSDRLLEQVVLLADESLEEYDTVSKQTMLYRELLSDEESKEDLIATIVDILGYSISPEYLFNVLADQAKQAIFQVRMDAELKEQVEVLYKELGTSFAEAVRIFAKQSVQENGMPFVITANRGNMKGCLSKYANTACQEREKNAFEDAMREKDRKSVV